MLLYTSEEIKRIEDQFFALPPDEESRKRERMFFASIDEVSLDKQGRLIIKEDFCKYASLSKDVVVLGAGNKIEIWDSEKWYANFNDSDEKKNYDDIKL